MSSDFKTVIGLEIHVQLNTKSKMFCGCDNDAQGKQPNELTCPICMGMPGTLPVANKKAIKKTLAMGLALKCKIAEFSKFDRKHYFYPDLPKGYQISQYDKPLCLGGEVELEGHTIRLNRIHLEEDAGKLLHPKGADYSVVDLNRAGTPLMEIVTEPDFTNPSQATNFLRVLQKMAKAIGVSDADMEKGHLRCDANINVIKEDKSSPIVEIKNLNSFKFVQKALEYEQKRLEDEFESFDGRKTKQTRGFNSKLGETYPLREKEEAKDYRYFPEPDLPPVIISEEKDFDLEEVARQMPVLPEVSAQNMRELGIDDRDITAIIERGLGEKFASCVALSEQSSCALAKFILNNKDVLPLENEKIVELVLLQIEKAVPSNIMKQIIDKVVKEEVSVAKAYEDLSNFSVDLDKIVLEVISKNADAVEKYKSGKKEVMGFLVGQVMKATEGQADPSNIKKTLEQKL